MPRIVTLAATAALLLCLHAPAHGSSEALCAEHRISARAVQTASDVQAFVHCAAAYLETHGQEEARRAFHEDARWRHGPTYVFVDEIGKAADQPLTIVFPPDPTLEGTFVTAVADSLGGDLADETNRLMSLVDSGWLYYSFRNPQTGRNEPKASFVIEVEWDSRRAVIGAGVYSPEIPGACSAEEVNATALAAAPSEASLHQFVRCAAQLVEEKGFSAKGELESSPRWRRGASYVFAMDLSGNQVLSGSPVRVNGRALHEWGGKSDPTDQFGGRNMVSVGDTFGEAVIYYMGRDPRTGRDQAKVAVLKRAVAHGVPLIVGAAYPRASRTDAVEPPCEDHMVTALGIRNRRDVQAYVRCAAEYVKEQGEEEAYRAFHEDTRWRHGQYYIFVNLISQADGEPLSNAPVFPPTPEDEGRHRVLVDNFGTDYFFELHRVMSHGRSAWLHYSFTNFVTGRSEPKSTYVVEIDWNGQRAVVGAGIYDPARPGTCYGESVNAASLEADPSESTLQSLVRCAATAFATQGYFGTVTLESDPRWREGSIYLFGLDTHGNALFTGAGRHSGSNATGSELRPDGADPFGGRDFVRVGDIFGEAFVYYRAPNPASGLSEVKTSLIKRVVIQGLPTLIGAGYYRDGAQ
ncbi:MAG: hypothetical protein OXH99_04300 [Bryobacterales bacterium]|nr:hypothetical protein [Bryobacterales bacterium]